MVEYSGEERRNCVVPCKAIADEIKEIGKCVKSKVSIRWFYALTCFVVVIIGGSQWAIVDRLGRIETSVAVMASEALESKAALYRHAILDKEQSERIRDLELRESSRHPEYFKQDHFRND